MPASFDDPPADRPRPPPSQSEIKDENVGTLFKIGGSGCVAVCACGMGLVFFLPALMFLPYGVSPVSGVFGLIGLLCIAVGCYAGYYGWQAADEGSKW